MTKTIKALEEVTIRFAGDSGDGMQVTGTQFADTTAMYGNDLSTLQDFPAEIRAPQGTLYGISSYQLHFGSSEINTPGDKCDVLVAMNPAALKVTLGSLRDHGIIIANTDGFTTKNLRLAGYETSPLEDGSLDRFQLYAVDITRLTATALQDLKLPNKVVERCKNFFALGLMYWAFSRPLEPTIKWVREKFAKREEIAEANVRALTAGRNFGETTEVFAVRYQIRPAELEAGVYRNITGNVALAYGLVSAAQRAGLEIFLGSYPITPASDILHILSGLKHFGVKTIQAEDEIASVTSAIGASFGGALGVTSTSGPGLSLKSEAIGLAVMTELPLVIINVQRAGPSTGMPTKVEQADLMQAMYGRNGEAPAVVIAPGTPAECFEMAYEAARIAVKFMTPVLVLSDAFLANGSEPWRLPEVESLTPFHPHYHTDPAGFQPYSRDAQTLARPWAIPGIPGLEHRIGGLEKEDGSGNISYDAHNHEKMTQLRAEKIARVAADIPQAEIEGDSQGDLLVVGWGSTYGSIKTAVEAVRSRGKNVSHLHLRYINPMPSNVGELLYRFKSILIPELNNGQLSNIIRARYVIPTINFNQIQGRPFQSTAIEAKIDEILASETGID